MWDWRHIWVWKSNNFIIIIIIKIWNDVLYIKWNDENLQNLNVSNCHKWLY
jgi:hypothetical protein